MTESTHPHVAYPPIAVPSAIGQMMEEDIARLHRAIRATFSPPAAARTLAEAGRRAAEELLRPFSPEERRRRLSLPRDEAVAGLFDLLHAWAPFFVAERRLVAVAGARPALIIAGNPLCDGAPRGMRVCAWHTALFETLFQALVAPEALVRETACLAQGDPECRFEVDFGMG